MPIELSGPAPSAGLGTPLAVLIPRGEASEGPARRYQVASIDTTIGRQDDNALVLDHPSVAARHARLRLAGGVWSLADGGSVQGSVVDGDVAVAPMPLAPGSLIRLGEVELVFDPRDRWQDSPVPGPEAPGYDLKLPSQGGVPIRALMWTAIGAVTVVAFLLVWGG